MTLARDTVDRTFQPTRESRLIGRRLRDLRVDKGMTLDQVCEALCQQIASATLSRTERGTRRIMDVELEILAELYRVKVEDITAPEPEPPAVWEIVTPIHPEYQPPRPSSVMTPEQYALRVYLPQLEAENKDLREQLAMFRGEA